MLIEMTRRASFREQSYALRIQTCAHVSKNTINRFDVESWYSRCTKARAENGSNVKDPVSFRRLKTLIFHSMGGELHNGIACLKRYNSLLFVSFYLVGIEMICALRRPSVCKDFHIYVTIYRS